MASPRETMTRIEHVARIAAPRSGGDADRAHGRARDRHVPDDRRRHGVHAGPETFRLTESIARLQENGRFALDAIEPDIRMAHFWGLTTRTTKVADRAAPAEPERSRPRRLRPELAIDLDNAVEGANNGYALACGAGPAGGRGHRPNSDTLVVRRVAGGRAPAALVGQHDVRTIARASKTVEIFAGDGDSRRLHGGHERNASTHRERLLREPELDARHERAVAADEDARERRRDRRRRSAAGRRRHADPARRRHRPCWRGNRGSIDRYVNPGRSIVTPWIRRVPARRRGLRGAHLAADSCGTAENGFTDTSTYVYADRNVGALTTPFGECVVSKTIYLRNARPAT